MEIKEICNQKERFMNLLLEADPEETVVNKYIKNGEMYGLFENDRCLCVAVITKVDKDTCELKNIATLKEARGKGYAKKIIKYVFEKYKNNHKRMIVGTTENMIPFYVLNGFTKYHHTVKNFFLNNYQKDIYDGNLHCIDMFYYSKEFNKIDDFNYKAEKISEDIRENVNNILINEWGSTDIVIRGKIVDGTKLQGYVALKDNEIIGLITYMIENEECEICSLDSFIENKGIGTSLINKVEEVAKENKCKKLKLITTNDNIRGIAFYQKRGFTITDIYKNAMETSRKIKPQIPICAKNGILNKDEIEFQKSI